VTGGAHIVSGEAGEIGYRSTFLAKKEGEAISAGEKWAQPSPLPNSRSSPQSPLRRLIFARGPSGGRFRERECL
jgi:hypothetical protein